MRKKWIEQIIQAVDSKQAELIINQIEAAKLPAFIHVFSAAGERDSIYQLKVNKIAYVFFGIAYLSNLFRDTPVDHRSQSHIHERRLYIRTVDGKTYCARQRSMRELLAILGPRFVQVHQSMAVNNKRVAVVYHRLEAAEVGVEMANGSNAWLVGSKRFRKRLIQNLATAH